MLWNSIVRDVCGDNWQSASDQERDGGYGIAIVLAYLQGCRPDVNDISRNIKVSRNDLMKPFNILDGNGVFRPNSWVLKERLLFGKSDGLPDQEYRTRKEWCNIAALASGFLGKGTV